MAGRFVRICLIGGLLFCSDGWAQNVLPLSAAAARTGNDRRPAHQSEEITVEGVVSAGPIWFPDYDHVTIQDDSGAGLTLELQRDQIRNVRPGLKLRVQGILHERAGLPVLRVGDVVIQGQTAPPAPQHFKVAELNQLENLSRYVVTEGLVQWAGQNAGGELLNIGSEFASVQVFLPFAERKRAPMFGIRFHAGDRVRVTGISAQYSPYAPYDSGFEVIIPDRSAVTLLAEAWLISPLVFVSGLAGAAILAMLWWFHDQKLRVQRRTLRGIMMLAEEVIAADSPVAIARRLEAAPQELLHAGSIELYLYNNDALERVLTDRQQQALSVPVDEETGTVAALVAICFRNRAALTLPSVRNSPLVDDDEPNLPVSAVLAPMVANGEVAGVIALFYSQKPDLSPDFQAAIQHLANQVAASLKLQEQRLMKEQLLRSEKMAAAGQLISGVANDLQVPLANITRASRQLLERTGSDVAAELREIHSEAERGTDLVEHLLSFANMERREPKLVDVHALVSRLLDLRSEEQKRRGIRAVTEIPLTPIEVLADQAQLEQALISVIVHAEHAALNSPDHCLQISSRIVGTQVQILFESASSSGQTANGDPVLEEYFGSPVAEAILQTHGGELRNSSAAMPGFRLEVTLPVFTPTSTVGEPQPKTGKPGRVLTAAIFEPDTVAQRRLMSLLSARGHRAIPANSPEDAADLVQRMQFDILFCTSRVAGLPWTELFQRVRRRVGVFALMTEDFDPRAAQAFANGEGQVLPKPIEDRALDNILSVVELRWAVSRR